MDEDYQFNLEAVRAQMRKEARHALRPGYCYTSGIDFLLQHGIDYKPTPWRGQFKQGAPKNCYGNAIVLAGWYGLRYIEGVCLSPVGMVIPHAWNLNAKGKLIDSTWLNTGLVYIGVEFSVERADDAIWHGDACVLDDWKRRWPLFKQPWTGEDYTIEWPASDRLDMLRSSKKVTPKSVLEFEAERGRAWTVKD
jgi:hypothetical protein